MVIDRYMAIRKPIFYRTNFSGASLKYIIVSVTIVAIPLCFTPVVVRYTTNDVNQWRENYAPRSDLCWAAQSILSRPPDCDSHHKFQLFRCGVILLLQFLTWCAQFCASLVSSVCQSELVPDRTAVITASGFLSSVSLLPASRLFERTTKQNIVQGRTC